MILEKCVIILGGSISQKAFVNSIIASNYKVILVDKNFYSPLKDKVHFFLNTDIKNHKKIILKLSKFKSKLKFVASYTIADYGINTLAKINKKFKIIGLNEKLAGFFTNKELTKKKIIEANVDVPKTFYYGDFKKFKNFLEKDNLENYEKLVIKCPDQNNSIGLTILKKINKLELKRSVINSLKFSKNVIIEEFIEGKTYSIDCIIINNNIKIVSTSENIYYSKNKINNFCVLQPSKLKKKIIGQIKRKIFKIFDKVKNYKGPLTIDFIVNKDKIYFLEISPHFHSASAEVLRNNGNPLLDYIKCTELNKIINFRRKPNQIIMLIKKFRINKLGKVTNLLKKIISDEKFIHFECDAYNEKKHLKKKFTLIIWLRFKNSKIPEYLIKNI